MIRRLLPGLVYPLILLATGLAGAPWLRVFPAATMAVPLFGAAVLSVLVPFVVYRLRRSLAIGLLADVVVFVLYSLAVVLREPVGLGDLVSGFVHGPAQLLTFALPLVSPRSLLIAPVALVWLSGALAGEAMVRRPDAVLPYFGWIAAFGVSYAATERSRTLGSSANAHVDTALAVGLFAVLALLRVMQTWTARAVGPQATQGDGEIPLRPVFIGVITVVVVMLLAGVGVQAGAFGGVAKAPQRVPAVNQANPVTPLAFVASLRPLPDSTSDPQLFTVTTSAPSNGYFALANVDYYDGDSWSFTRTFRPSGGVVPADLDPSLNPGGAEVSQTYRVLAGGITAAPWMPYLSRPVRVVDASINVDAASGMIVPVASVQAGTTYTVTSASAPQTLVQLPATSLLGSGAAPIDTQLPAGLRTTLGKVVDSLALETGKATTSPTEFLQALAKDLRSNYGLSGGPAPTFEPNAAAPSSAAPTSGTPGQSDEPHAGGTNFSDVVASIIGPQRAGTPEQFATLFAMVARQIGVPARVVTGFKVPAAGDASATLAAGNYRVTGSEATTWVEVPVRGSGWVVVDAAPTTFKGPQQNNSIGAAEPSSTPAPLPSQNALLGGDNGGHAVAAKSAVPKSAAPSPWPIVIGVVIGLVVLALLVVVLLLLRKRRRLRRRRGLDDPRQRVIGAWSEGLDRLAESGLPQLAALTGSEVATATSLRYGQESGIQVATLARVADVAIFSPRATISDELADEAWRSQKSLQKSVRSQLGWFARMGAALRHSRVSAARAELDGPLFWTASAPVTAPRRRRFGRPGSRRSRLH